MPIPREPRKVDGHILLSSTRLRRHQQQMQEHIDLLLVQDAINYTRVNRSNRQTLSLNGQQPQ